MFIFVDESGSFAPASETGAWNVVAGYVSPEDDYAGLVQALGKLKATAGVQGRRSEVKLRDVSEASYLNFIRDLLGLNGVLFAVACDAGMQTEAEIRDHQRRQGDFVVMHKDKMHFARARDDVENFAGQIRGIAPQLYVQLYCHIYMIYSVLNRGLVYFVQRTPQRLDRLRWRVDQKDAVQNVFEESYLMLALPVLQSMSLSMPMIRLHGADYSAFQRFEYAPGEAPTYLQDDYGIETTPDMGVNLGMMIREDFRFQDSLQSAGVQVADLLNSGLRRCLRGGFEDNTAAASLLGALLVQDRAPRYPIDLVGFGEAEGAYGDETAGRAVALMTRHCRPMISRDWEPSAGA